MSNILWYTNDKYGSLHYILYIYIYIVALGSNNIYAILYCDVHIQTFFLSIAQLELVINTVYSLCTTGLCTMVRVQNQILEPENDTILKIKKTEPDIYSQDCAKIFLETALCPILNIALVLTIK